MTDKKEKRNPSREARERRAKKHHIRAGSGLANRAIGQFLRDRGLFVRITLAEAETMLRARKRQCELFGMAVCETDAKSGTERKRLAISKWQEFKTLNPRQWKALERLGIAHRKAGEWKMRAIPKAEKRATIVLPVETASLMAEGKKTYFDWHVETQALMQSVTETDYRAKYRAKEGLKAVQSWKGKRPKKPFKGVTRQAAKPDVSNAEDQPWRREGISRRTWYRRRSAANEQFGTKT